MRKTVRLLQWVLSIFLLLFCLMTDVPSFSGVLFILAGLLVMPPVSVFLFNKIAVYNGKIKWGAFLLFLVLAFALFPGAETNNNENDAASDFTTGAVTTEITTVVSIETGDSINTVVTSTSIITDIEEQDKAESEGEESRRFAEEQTKAEFEAEESLRLAEMVADTGDGVTVYKTPTGKRYHYDHNCGGKNSSPTTLQSAQAIGLTPCKKCAQ